jgi:hypothetical protein
MEDNDIGCRGMIILLSSFCAKPPFHEAGEGGSRFLLFFLDSTNKISKVFPRAIFMHDHNKRRGRLAAYFCLV